MPGSNRTSIPSPLHTGAQPIPYHKSPDEGLRLKKAPHSVHGEMSAPDSTSSSMISDRDIQSTKTLPEDVQVLADDLVSLTYDIWLLSVSSRLETALQDPQTRFDQYTIQSIKKITCDKETISLIEKSYRNTQLEDQRYLKLLSNLKKTVDSAIQLKYPKEQDHTSLKKIVKHRQKKCISDMKAIYSDTKTIISNISNRKFVFPKDPLQYTAGAQESLLHKHRKTQTRQEFPKPQRRNFGTSPSHPLRKGCLKPTMDTHPARTQSVPDLSSPEKSRYGTGYDNREERMSPKKRGSLPPLYDRKGITDWLTSSQSSLDGTIPPEHPNSGFSAKNHKRHFKEDTDNGIIGSPFRESAPESHPRPHISLSSRRQTPEPRVMTEDHSSASSVDDIKHSVPVLLHQSHDTLSSDRSESSHREMPAFDLTSRSPVAGSGHIAPRSPARSQERLSLNSASSVHSEEPDCIAYRSPHQSVCGILNTSSNSLPSDRSELLHSETNSHGNVSSSERTPEHKASELLDEDRSSTYPRSIYSDTDRTSLTTNDLDAPPTLEFEALEGHLPHSYSANSWPWNSSKHPKQYDDTKRSLSLSDLTTRREELLRDTSQPFSDSFSGATVIQGPIHYPSSGHLMLSSASQSTNSHASSLESQGRLRDKIHTSEEERVLQAATPEAKQPSCALTLPSETEDRLPNQVESPLHRSTSHDVADNMTSSRSVSPVPSEASHTSSDDCEWIVEGCLSISRRNSFEKLLMMSSEDSESENSEYEVSSPVKRDISFRAPSDDAVSISVGSCWDEMDIALTLPEPAFDLDGNILSLNTMITQIKNQKLNEAPVIPALNLLETTFLAQNNEESASTTIIVFRELLIELTDGTHKKVTTLLTEKEESTPTQDEDSPNEINARLKKSMKELKRLSSTPTRINETPNSTMQRNTRIFSKLIDVISLIRDVEPTIADQLEDDIKNRILSKLSEGLDQLERINRGEEDSTDAECEELPLDSSRQYLIPNELRRPITDDDSAWSTEIIERLSKTGAAEVVPAMEATVSSTRVKHDPITGPAVVESSPMSVSSDMKSESGEPIKTLDGRSTWDNYLPLPIGIESSDEHKPHVSGQTSSRLSKDTCYDFQQTSIDKNKCYKFRQTLRGSDELLEVHIIEDRSASMPAVLQPCDEGYSPLTPEKRPKRQSVAKRLFNKQ
ncbi:hypothetical protein [Kistimonas asteriae]|uniref:hypothetical protein n=1 Tax=Kistimonas asteriae TaxID=517724 RepID=UPI001BA483CA|nr:hypothetical protein [Kistimonas asteriae]